MSEAANELWGSDIQALRSDIQANWNADLHHD